MRKVLPTSWVPTVLCVPLALLAAAALKAALLLPALAGEMAFRIEADGMGRLVYRMLEGGAPALLVAEGPVGVLASALRVCGALWAAAGVLGLLVRRPWALRLVRAGYAGLLAAGGALAYAAVAATGTVIAAYRAAEPDAGDAAYRAFLLGWGHLRWLLPAGALAAGMLVLSWRGRTAALYRPQAPPTPAGGDRLVESLRTGGRDPAYRRSWLSSACLHWLIIVALPFLWAFRGCIEPYLVPYGRGQARVARVMQVVKRTQTPRKKYILRKNAAVYWEIPDLNESRIAQEVNEQTQLTHVADRNALHGKMGAGGGTKGGWPDGVPGGKIRFIRLEYRGRDWDDGMDAQSRADMNFLDFLRQEVPFPVARQSESHRIGLLSRYPKGLAPPFVYMTGSDSIDVPPADRRILREYLIDGGGMLFADAGSARWDHSFRGFLRAAFPDKRLIDVADDDEIYQMPYAFANGAPPLWHHGGFRAMGIKHAGRWIVFYHPGDINDAWKTGRSGMDPAIADKAFQMGINVMYYSITRYLQLTKRYRKP